MNPYAALARIQHPRNGAVDPLAETLSRAAFRAVEAIEATVVTVIEHLREGHRRRVTIRELSALDDHNLRDIGLQRSQIPSVAQALAADAEPGRAAGRTGSAPIVVKAATPPPPANDNPAPRAQDQFRAVACAG